MDHRRNTRRILEEALALARESSPEEATALLDKGLVDARGEGDARSVAILARNAAIISTSIGEFQRAIDYFLEAARSQPEDASLQIALADLYEELGQRDRARALLSASYKLAVSRGDEDALAVLRTRKVNGDPDT